MLGFSFNFQKKRYIKSRMIISAVLFITGAKRREVYSMGRGSAFYARQPSGVDRVNFSNEWSSRNLISVWQMVIWAIATMAIEKPIIVLAGIICLPFIPVSILMKVF